MGLNCSRVIKYAIIRVVGVAYAFLVARDTMARETLVLLIAKNVFIPSVNEYRKSEGKMWKFINPR